MPPGPGWWDCFGAGTIDRASALTRVREGRKGEGKGALEGGQGLL